MVRLIRNQDHIQSSDNWNRGHFLKNLVAQLILIPFYTYPHTPFQIQNYFTLLFWLILDVKNQIFKKISYEGASCRKLSFDLTKQIFLLVDIYWP